ncbi:EpsG family protein [Pelosinus propionicus]|nr:EpsG family protein [Pelosinus propionicus]
MFSTMMDFINLNQKQYIKYIIICIIYFSLAFLAGLRYETGLDYSGYNEIYNDVTGFWNVISGESNYADIHGEYGYLLLNSILKSFFDDFSFVILSMSFIGLGFIVYSCYKYSKFFFLSMFLYVTRFFFVRDMGQIRTAVACAIILYSIEAIEKRLFIRFIILIALAASFHSAALIAFPIYFISSYRFKKRVYCYSLFIAIIIGAFFPFKELIMEYLGDIGGSIINYIFSGYGESLSMLNPVTLLQTAILLIFIYFKEKLQKKIYGYNTILNMYAFSTFWLIIFNDLGIIAGRISTMLATIEIFIIPSFLLIRNNQNIKFLNYILILLFGLSLLYAKFMQNDMYQLFIPYKSVL